MCGIAGYLGRPSDAALTKRMTDLMVHRGPDDEGFFHAERVALGMRRLAIIDRDGGAQPIRNEQGDIVVVYNGEIYNHAELRKTLEELGHQFATNADTEVLIHGYEQWGLEGMLSRLNGMFAFALYDQQKATLLLARDRLGIKPLYYTRQNGVLYFASEVKALLGGDEISLQPNEDALAEYLTLRYVPAPATLFKDIVKLPAGHYMTVGADAQPKIARYWFPKPDSEHLSDSEYVERFGELFQDAVKIRLMSEVPLGAYLSAGLDSNMVVGAMARELDMPVTTYSMGFGGKYDETAGARESANVLQTRHHEIMFASEDLEEMARVLWHLDEPIGDAHTIPTYLLAREAKKDLTVILLGEGADESLYGYPFYKVAWLARSFSRMVPQPLQGLMPKLAAMAPLAALNTVFPLPTSLGPDGKQHVVDFLDAAPLQNGEVIFRQLSGLFGAAELGELMLRPPAYPGVFPTSYFEHDDAELSPDALAASMNNAQMSGWLQDNILLRHDKMAMAHSAECRVPFLDHRLVEFLAGVPRRLKISGWKDKIISRRFARRLLPKSICRRPKQPFFVPVEKMMASKFLQELIRDNLSDERIRKRGYFRPEAVRQLKMRAAADNFLAVKKVMSLVMLELWHRIFIDRELQF